MFKNIKRRLGLEPHSPYVKNYFRMANMQSATYMSFIVSALEVWMIVSLFVEMYTDKHARSASWFAQHLTSYVLLLAVSIFLFIHAFRYTHAKSHDYRLGTVALVSFP